MVGNFANLREMYARSQSRTVPVIVIGDDVLVGFDRKQLDQLLSAHGYTDAT